MNIQNISVAIMALISLTLSRAAHADSYQPIWQCSSAVRSADLDLARVYAAKVLLISPIFGEPTLDKATGCLNYAFGEDWVYDKAIHAFVNPSGLINDFTAGLLSAEQNASYHTITSNSAYLTETAVNLLADQEAEVVALAAKQEAVRLRVCELRELVEMYDKTIQQAEAASQDRRIETLSATVQECSSWFNESPKEALTNDMCNSIFAAGGLPNSTIAGPSQSELLLAELSKQNAEKELEIVAGTRMLLKDYIAQYGSEEADDGYNCGN